MAVHTTRGTTRNQNGFRRLEQTNLNEEHEIQNYEEHRNQGYVLVTVTNDMISYIMYT